MTMKSKPLSPRELREYNNRLAEDERSRRAEFDEECKKAGLSRTQIRAADGSIPNVWLTRDGQMFRKFDDRQKLAAQRFMALYERAYGGPRSASLEMKVDGGGPDTAVYASRIEAQQMLKRIRSHLGDYLYDFAESVAYGLSARAIHQMGGEQHVVVNACQKAAMDQLDVFFSGKARDDRTITAIRAMILQVEQAKREAE